MEFVLNAHKAIISIKPMNVFCYLLIVQLLVKMEIAQNVLKGSY